MTRAQFRRLDRWVRREQGVPVTWEWGTDVGCTWVCGPWTLRKGLIYTGVPAPSFVRTADMPIRAELAAFRKKWPGKRFRRLCRDNTPLPLP